MRSHTPIPLLIFVVFSLFLAACTQFNAVDQQATKKPIFTILNGTATNLKFKNIIPENARMNSLSYEYYYNGGGVAAGDVNKDGLSDLYFTGNVTPNRLYLNEGNFKFRDITELAGLKDTPSWTTGVSMVDFNADGIMDIYVCRSGKLEEDQRRNQFFISQGMKDGVPVYQNMAKELGLNDPGYGTQIAFFDFDRDGDLDAFLLNHNVEVKPFYDVKKLKRKRHPYVGDKLYRNDNGKFIDISGESGIYSHELGYGLGISIGDVNNDGWPDIYVGNDYSEHDYLYINNHDGTFTEGSAEAFGHTSNFSMGTDIADFNNDGLLDIMSLDMVAADNYGIKTSMSGMDPERFKVHLQNGLQHQYMYNALQMNRGSLHYSEIAQLAGVHSTDWSWAPLFLDIDLDGHKDLFITNGLKRDFRNNDFRNYKIQQLEAAEQNDSIDRHALIKELVAKTPMKKIVNYVFRNNGDLTFENKQKDWGIMLPSFSNGATYADLDGDGDLDIVTNNIDEEPYVYRNNVTKIDHGYLKVSFRGPETNIDGIGTRVSIKYKGKMQIQEHYLTRGYQSSVDKGLLFGLGHQKTIDTLEVLWADGKYQLMTHVKSNQELIIQYDQAKDKSQIRHDVKPIFNEVTDQIQLDFKHHEQEFNDFKRESLIPHKMSELGPALAVADVNGDGWDDIFVGAAVGQSGQLWIQNADGIFWLSKNQPWIKHSGSEDVEALFFDANGDGQADLYIASGSNEFDIDSKRYRDRLYLNHLGKFEDASYLLPAIFNSSSVIKAVDIDDDGDLDLFVGGRQIPGNYGKPANSHLLENNGGTFNDITDQIAPDLKGIGMVTDAIWSDINQDGQLDLILVGEWMPVTILLQSATGFKKQSFPGTKNSTGWWNCIEQGDFDQDGDIDFVIGNNGLNYKYKAAENEPFSIYTADFDQNGSNDIVLGYFNQGIQYPLRGRECSSNQMSFIKEKFPTYHAFGKATLSDVYDLANLQQSLHYHVKTFASVYVENVSGDSLVFHELPALAQLSSINDLIVKDFNADGKLDIMAAGNLYQSEVETPRNDASHGILFYGDGAGYFTPIPNHQNGLYLSGDVKQMDWIRFADGNSGVVVGRNNDAIQVYKKDSSTLIE